jgi:hypothetical protein
MQGQVFVALGDITQVATDAVAFSTSTFMGKSGNLYPAFHEHVPGHRVEIFVDAS